jgi:hypothetical protein
MLVCRASGQLFVIATTWEAHEFLTSERPVSSCNAYFAALETCDRVSTGATDRELAKLAFIEAAEEAGIPVNVVGVVDSVEERLCCVRCRRNMMSLSGSSRIVQRRFGTKLTLPMFSFHKEELK